MRGLAVLGVAGLSLACTSSAIGSGSDEDSTAAATSTTTDASSESGAQTGTTTAAASSEDGSSEASTAGAAESGESSSSDSGDPPATCPEDDAFPEPQWPEGEPIEHGLDPAALEEAALYAGANESLCMVVIRDGHLVFERYWNDATPDTKLRTYSIAKSYTASLVGIALAQGVLGSVDDPLVDYLPELAGTPKQDIALLDLLTMTSGVYAGVFDEYVLLTFSPDHTRFALDAQPSGSIGAAWEYSNVGVQLLEPVLRSATGMDVDEYAAEHLWGPIGMEATWDRDLEGHALTYQNVRASCRDHARFGYLWLRRGCWNGERVLEESFVDAALTPSQEHNRGYGWLFWIAGQQPTLESVSFDEIEGGLDPFAPAGTFSARGLGGQVIEVIPAFDMVVVRLGYAPQDAPGAWLDPIGLVQELLDGNDEDVPTTMLEMILDGVTE